MLKHKTSGIYRIIHTPTGREYIGGSSYCIRQRFCLHRSLLRRNRHHGRFLQRVWNKSEESEFVFEVVEFCDPSVVISREQHYLDSRKPVFNSCKKADAPGSVARDDEYKRVWSERAKQMWKNPEYRAKVVSAVRINSQKPEWKKFVKEMFAKSRTIENEKKRKLAAFSPSAKASRARSLKEKFKNQEFKDSALRARGIIERTVISPIGEEFTFLCASDFCRSMNLKIPNFHKMLSGKNPTAEGWRLKNRVSSAAVE